MNAPIRTTDLRDLATSQNRDWIVPSTTLIALLDAVEAAHEHLADCTDDWPEDGLASALDRFDFSE